MRFVWHFNTHINFACNFEGTHCWLAFRRIFDGPLKIQVWCALTTTLSPQPPPPSFHIRPDLANRRFYEWRYFFRDVIPKIDERLLCLYYQLQISCSCSAVLAASSDVCSFFRAMISLPHWRRKKGNPQCGCQLWPIDLGVSLNCR